MERQQGTAADHRELERLYQEDGARLQRAILLYTGSREIADDAVAEAFAQALRRGADIRSPSAWIWRVAFRIAAGELKERSRRAGVATEGGYQIPEDAIDLIAALRRLSSKQRAAVVLHHFGGYTGREIAGMVGSTSAAVMVHLSQGRKRLRRLLEEE